MADELPHRKAPCNECPWRRDAQPGKFSAERYDALSATSHQPQISGLPDVFAQPMFGCHKGQPGTPDADLACAGWLAVDGTQHIGVRLALIQGRLPADVIDPKPGWPALYDSYAEMAEVNRKATQ